MPQLCRHREPVSALHVKANKVGKARRADGCRRHVIPIVRDNAVRLALDMPFETAPALGLLLRHLFR
ncbi:hypothetical protein D9M73_120130 [compost metagenome]